MKPKADLRVIDSPKKQTNEFVLFAFLLFMANMTKKICSFLFLGESTARPNCFWSYLTFSSLIGVFHYCDFCLRVSGQIFLCSSKLWQSVCCHFWLVYQETNELFYLGTQFFLLFPQLDRSIFTIQQRLVTRIHFQHLKLKLCYLYRQ